MFTSKAKSVVRHCLIKADNSGFLQTADGSALSTLLRVACTLPTDKHKFVTTLGTDRRANFECPSLNAKIRISFVVSDNDIVDCKFENGKAKMLIEIETGHRGMPPALLLLVLDTFVSDGSKEMHLAYPSELTEETKNSKYQYTVYSDTSETEEEEHDIDDMVVTKMLIIVDFP